jgi:murein L,D-transpeptidase YcbB/YkuD
MGDGIVYKNNKVDSMGLASAISSFQKRHQMKEDGLFNDKNISLILKDLDRTKIKLKNSLLRLKRLELPNETMVFINIPDYNLKYIDEAGVELLSCPVIVGKPSWPSKTMISAIDEVVFCPYWNIPNGILSKEIMPLVRKQKNYLQKHNMEWKNGRLRQKPGKSNALGFIKFIFPNPYHIYLHDTPNRNLFLKQKRAFSHGCIRLYCVNELAKMLLKQDESWILNRASSCDKGEESRVKLKVKMRIVIVYTTAWVNSRGQVEIRDDIYNKDK